MLKLKKKTSNKNNNQNIRNAVENKSILQVIQPTITKKELKSILECIILDDIEFGNIVNEYEKKILQYFNCNGGAVSAISLNAVYLLIFQSLGVHFTDEVIISSIYSISAFDAIHHVKAKPIILDIEKNSFLVSPDSILNSITPNTKIIIISYDFGSYKDYAKLIKLIREGNFINTSTNEKFTNKNIIIIEDISYIAGGFANSNFIGSLADISIIGLNKDMIMTIGQGAVMLIRSREIYKEIHSRRIQKGGIPYRYCYDFNISNYQAAMAIEQLENLPIMIERRKKIGGRYLHALSKTNYLQTYFSSFGIHVYGSFIIIDNGIYKKCNRHFQKYKIPTKKMIWHYPLHRLANLEANLYPNTEKLYERGFAIPLYPNLDKKHINNITNCIQTYSDQ